LWTNHPSSIFLVTGLITVISVPFVYWKLDNDPCSARFLTEHERAQAVERLRANQANTTSQELKWSQVAETFWDTKTYWFIGLSLGNNLGAQVINTFGPLILSGLGFDKYMTSLLNMPFGAIQYLAIIGSAVAVAKVKWKSLVLLVMLGPILAGLILLYVVSHDAAHTAPLMVGYYLLALIFGCNTLIVSWIIANTAGQTKKSTMMSLYNAAASAGNIIGPLLFSSTDAPAYRPGVRKVLGVYVMMFALVFIQAGNLFALNRAHRKTRVANGKPGQIHDHSMESEYTDLWDDNSAIIGQAAFEDLTDRQNDEFIYVY